MIKGVHERSVHIDAPVDTVVDYSRTPDHFFEAFDAKWRRHMALAEVMTTPVRVGATFRLMGKTRLSRGRHNAAAHILEPITTT